MRGVKKKEILGNHPQDKDDQEVQYMNLHKKLKQIQSYLENLRKIK